MTSVLTQKIIDTESLPFPEVLESGGKIYTFLNPVSYLDALKQKDLFSAFDGIFADGSLLAAAIRLMYGKKVTRRSFDMTSVAPLLMEKAREKGKTIYIVASQQEQVERAVEFFRERYEGIKIVGARNGYFNGDEEQEVEARRIVELNPDYLIVGMGIVSQERFLLKVKQAGYKGIGFTCGGFIHQTAKDEIDYYPAWIDKANLRFAYRMYKEPHTRMRYLRAGFVFPIRYLCERFCF